MPRQRKDLSKFKNLATGKASVKPDDGIKQDVDKTFVVGPAKSPKQAVVGKTDTSDFDYNLDFVPLARALSFQASTIQN